MSELQFPADMVTAIDSNMGTTDYDELRKLWVYRAYTDLKFVWGSDTIGASAFDNAQLTTALIPQGVTTLGEHAFHMCIKLTTASIPEGVTALGGQFTNCYTLKEISLPKGLLSIGSYAFNAAKFTKLVIPSTVTKIGDSGVFNCVAGAKIYFTGTPTTFGSNAFSPAASKTFDIYVPWSEGEVANAPWGATKATIHYNYTYTGME